METELFKEYKERVVPALRERLGYKNLYQVPRVEKVVINTCISTQSSDAKQGLEDAKAELALITGQRPAETRSKKSISNFKLRKDQPIGAKVTLRGAHMYEFLQRLIKMSLPRIRDFRGVSPRAFDGRGNYTLGVREQIIFPEIDYDEVDQTRGLDITITTNGCTDEESFALLEALGMPFAKDGRSQAA